MSQNVPCRWFVSVDNGRCGQIRLGRNYYEYITRTYLLYTLKIQVTKYSECTSIHPFLLYNPECNVYANKTGFNSLLRS